MSAYSDSINNRNILARINLSSIVQKNGVYQTGEDDGFSTQVNRSRQYFGPVNISKVSIKLLNDHGDVINLNGGNLYGFMFTTSALTDIAAAAGALTANLGGSNNTAVGEGALSSNNGSAASNNTAVGWSSLNANSLLVCFASF